MQSLQSRTHSLRFICPDTQPKQVHSLCERSRIGKHSVVIGLGIEFSIAYNEHPACSTESPNVGKEVQMIQGDLKRLHASHGKACHGAVVAIRKCPEGRINVGNQDLCHIIFKRGCHLLHRLQHFGRTEGFSGKIGRSLARAPGIAICHYDDHRLAAFGRDQIVEDEVGVTLPNPSGLIFASAVLVFSGVIDDFVIVDLLSTNAGNTPMSVLIYSTQRGGNGGPALNALGTIMLVMSLVIAIIGYLGYRFLTRGERGSRLEALTTIAGSEG